MTAKELYAECTRCINKRFKGEAIIELRVSSNDTVYCEKVDDKLVNPKCCNVRVITCQERCPHFVGLRHNSDYFVVKCTYKKPVISDEVIKTLTEAAAACWLEARTQQGYGNHQKEDKWTKRQVMFKDLAKEFLGDHSALTKLYPERKKSHPEIIQAANGDIHIVFRKVKEFDSEDRYGVRDNVIVRRREHGKIVEVIIRGEQ